MRMSDVYQLSELIIECMKNILREILAASHQYSPARNWN